MPAIHLLNYQDNDGDFGICVAAWKGVKKGVAGVKGTSDRKGVAGIPGNPGHFLMHFLNLRTGLVRKVKLSGNSSSQLVDLEYVVMDWNSGHILIKREDGCVAQNMCLAFVTSTLYLLVQPRYIQK